MDPTNAAGTVRLAADERTNTLLVRGEARLLAEVRRLARDLDKPGGATPTTRMFRLNYADAEAVADVLQGLIGERREAVNPVARSLAASGPSLARRGNLGGTDIAAIGAMANIAETGEPAAERTPASPSTSPPASTGFSTPDLTVQTAPELNAIVVRGTPAAIAGIEPLIGQLDVRRPQVMIEAAIVEITGDDAEALGVQLGIGGAALDRGSGAATSFTNLGLPLQRILGLLGAPAAAAILPSGASANIRVDDDFSILVQALGQSTKANLLSTPSLTTLDNQPAEIVVGQNVPFRTGAFTTDGNITNPFTTIERQDVGITLRVVPRVHQGDVVRLEVAQEVSSLVDATIAGAADLITNRRSIQTAVLADDRQTIVLGGLISDDRGSTRSQVPVLGDVPVVGELFKSRRESRSKRTLFVFLRPTILRDRSDAAAATSGKYDRLRADEAAIERRHSLLLNPPKPRLTLEIEGIY
jgi:general secretion pathway protein D